MRTYSRTGPVDLRWGGLTAAGEVAANGRYAVRLNGLLLGTFGLHSHIYPIRGSHDDRGGIGVFHAPRNGGRIHEGYDVMSPCGTPLVAARGGRVRKSTFDPVLYGNLVIIRGRKTHRDYWYAHLQSTPRVAQGRPGAHGRSGSARSAPRATRPPSAATCTSRSAGAGEPIDPAPLLHAWDGWS